MGMSLLVNILTESPSTPGIPDRVWTRKPVNLAQVRATVKPDMTGFEPGELPVIEVESLTEPFNDDFPNDPFYIITCDGQNFLVRSEGFNYPRYVVRLEADQTGA